MWGGCIAQLQCHRTPCVDHSAADERLLPGRHVLGVHRDAGSQRGNNEEGKRVRLS